MLPARLHISVGRIQIKIVTAAVLKPAGFHLSLGIEVIPLVLPLKPGGNCRLSVRIAEIPFAAALIPAHSVAVVHRRAAALTAAVSRAADLRRIILALSIGFIFRRYIHGSGFHIIRILAVALLISSIGQCPHLKAVLSDVGHPGVEVQAGGIRGDGHNFLRIPHQCHFVIAGGIGGCSPRSQSQLTGGPGRIGGCIVIALYSLQCQNNLQ